ncbi:MAG: GNAT family N-acetyltransferase [Rhodobacter sp.]|nr:GNAT family N-acetyltransferase [Rhodobacter sp.]
MEFQIAPGFAEDQRADAARLFWHAFQGKLGLLMRPEAKALAFFTATLDPAFAISATALDGTLLGLAGFKTADGAFAGGNFRDLARVYGTPGALWRAPLLALLERTLAPDTLLMDGIFVAETARGQGIGTALLDAIKAKAQARGLAHVRLDVIDTNPRARALYERQGFVAGHTEHLGPLRHLFGFRTVTTMIWAAPPA